MSLDLYIGVDESNNGKAFEIHTSVFSIHTSDAIELSKESLLPKLRSHQNLFGRLKKRDYSFLLFTDSDKKRISRYDQTGAIITSLIHGEFDHTIFDWTDFDSFNFILDGSRYPREIDRMVDMVIEKIPKIKPSKVSVSYGGKYDQRYPVVNLADQLAHYLFRKGLDYVSEHKDRKALLY